MAKSKTAAKKDAPETKKRGRAKTKDAAKNGNGSAAVVGFEQKLWQAADKMRNNMGAAKYKHVVLGLVFLKYISDAFEEKHAGLGGTQAIRDIIQSAHRSVELLDPYFGRRDLLEFARATTKHGLPFRVLTSADFCTSGDDPDLKNERGDALATTLDSVRSQDPRLSIEVKVMPDQKSAVHDRFLVVDGTVWGVAGFGIGPFWPDSHQVDYRRARIGRRLEAR